MASLEARYLASMVIEHKDLPDTDMGMLSRTVLGLLNIPDTWEYGWEEDEAGKIGWLATTIQNKFPDGEVPSWH